MKKLGGYTKKKKYTDVHIQERISYDKTLILLDLIESGLVNQFYSIPKNQ